MQIHRALNAHILDLRNELVVIPFEVTDPLKYDEDIKCSGFHSFVTRHGRRAIRVLPGTTYHLKLHAGGDDPTWGDWEHRRPETSVFGPTYGHAVSTNDGNKCWFEILIVPADGFIPHDNHQSLVHLDKLISVSRV